METCKMAYFLLLLLLPALYAEAQISFTNTGNTFEDGSGNQTWMLDMDAGDLEGDGDIDLIVNGSFDGANVVTTIFTNDGSGNYSLLSGTGLPSYFGTQVAFIDMEGDNDLDVVLSGNDFDTGTLYLDLYQNDGAGNFTLVAGTPFVGGWQGEIEVADLDGDTDEDIVVMHECGGTECVNIVYFNDGAGNFTQYDLPFGNFDYLGDITLGDVDGDNDLDIIKIPHGSGGATLYFNNNNGTFTNTTTSIPAPNYVRNAFLDIDGDNDLDLIVTGYTTSLYTNDGTGTFTLVPGTSFINNTGISKKMTLATGDFDGDNDEDIYLATATTGGFYFNDGFGNFYLDTSITFEDRTGAAIAINATGDPKVDLFIGGDDSGTTNATRLHTNTSTAFAPVALDFDGTNHYTAPHDNTLNTLPITFEMKIKVPVGALNGGLIGTLNQGGFEGWEVFLAGGALRCIYFSSPNRAEVASFAQLDDDVWHDVAVVVDNTGIKLYLDGILHNTEPWTGTPTATASTQDLVIGKREVFIYGGLLDEVRVWNTARTAAEIANNMCIPLADSGNNPNLIAYYNMNEYFDNTKFIDKSSATNTMTITAGTLTTAAEQAVCTSPTLPVELTRFTADTWQGQVRLEWATASESNNKGFHIEHSTNGADWEEIGFVHGNGDSNTPHAYSFLDKAPKQGMNYYRLKQVDFDEGHEYSDIANAIIQSSQVSGIKIFPNPASGHSLNIQNENGEIQLAIQNYMGKTIRSLSLPTGSHQLNIRDLPQGIYFINISSNGRNSVIKWERQY